MTVVKRKRKESPFEVFHHLTKMRKDITDLLLRDFGYSNEKFQKNLERKYGGKPPDQLTDIQRQNLERQKKRAEAFDEWFICQERNVIISCLHRINEHVYTANSIYPSCSEELIERRKHQNLAIGQCYRLVQELQNSIETLPVDVNAYLIFSEQIQKEIDLIKGWRKSDNKFRKQFEKE